MAMRCMGLHANFYSPTSTVHASRHVWHCSRHTTCGAPPSSIHTSSASPELLHQHRIPLVASCRQQQLLRPGSKVVGR